SFSLSNLSTFSFLPIHTLLSLSLPLQNIGQMLRSHFPQFPVHRGVPQRRNVQQCQRSLQDKVCRRSINCNKVREPSGHQEKPSPSCHYS
ncbi:hypothetical protein GBAR_LOCUS30399, partial [Geodia barretti]